MENVVLVIHLMIALAIIGLILLQRSSGGGLGIGGGGGGLGDFATARSTANALTKATAFCAFMFFCTSLTLGVLAKNQSAERAGSLFDNASAISNESPIVSDDLLNSLEEDMGEDSVITIDDASDDSVIMDSEDNSDIPEVPSDTE